MLTKIILILAYVVTEHCVIIITMVLLCNLYKIICGINEQRIQCRLLAESDLTFDKAVKIAQGMEAATRNSQLLSTASPRLHKVATNVARLLVTVLSKM